MSDEKHLPHAIEHLLLSWRDDNPTIFAELCELLDVEPKSFGKSKVSWEAPARDRRAEKDRLLAEGPIQTSTGLLPGRRPVDKAAALAVRPPPKSR